MVENLQDLKVTAKSHGDSLSSTFFVTRCDTPEDRAPCLPGFVPGGDRLSGKRVCGRVLDVEIIDSGFSLLEQFAGAVAEELVYCYLDFEGCVAVFLEDLEILVSDEGDLLVRGFGGDDIAERDVLETFGLANVVVIWLASGLV
jgi:hypothetical protein